jgi:hypothetical protein
MRLIAIRGRQCAPDAATAIKEAFKKYEVTPSSGAAFTIPEPTLTQLSLLKTLNAEEIPGFLLLSEF